MTADVVRPPRGAGEITADAVRVVAVLGVVVAAIWGTPTDAGILAFALPAVLAPRLLDLRPWFDISYGVAVLVAAWSNVLDLYRTVDGWDLVVHFVCTGLVAAMAYLALSRGGIVPAQGRAGFSRRVPLVIAPLIALAASALWEMVEWVGYEFISDEIHVDYTDTIGDMVAGGLGGLGAGVLLACVRLERRAGAVREHEPATRIDAER